MNIKLFFEIVQDFFDSIYSQGIDDENLEENNDDFINACSKFLSFIHSK